MAYARTVGFLCLLITSSSFAFTLSMKKKNSKGLYSKTYFERDNKLFLKTNSNYFDSFDGKAKFGLFEIKNRSDLKAHLAKVNQLSKALEKVHERLGDKMPNYTPKDERVWFILDGRNINQYSPYYEEIGKIYDAISRREKLIDKDILSLERKKGNVFATQIKGKNSSIIDADLMTCSNENPGLRCEIKEKGIGFFPK